MELVEDLRTFEEKYLVIDSMSLGEVSAFLFFYSYQLLNSNLGMFINCERVPPKRESVNYF